MEANTIETAYQIRPYNTDYHKRCVDMFYRVFTLPPFTFSWLDKEKLDRYFTDMENTPRFLSFLCLEGDTLLGACFGQVDDYFMAPGYRINEFFVDGDHQDQGLGTYFLREVEEILRNEGIETTFLFALRNTKAYQFYQHNDFLVNDETAHLVKVLR